MIEYLPRIVDRELELRLEASGATLKNREEAMAMLHDLDEMMGESK